jgi:hypothetical protein
VRDRSSVVSAWRREWPALASGFHAGNADDTSSIAPHESPIHLAHRITGIS